MPELPEVEVLVRHLGPLLRGQRIRGVTVARAKLVRAKQTSTQLSTYFVGRMAHVRMREQMQRELADLLMFELKDPRVNMVTITGVEVTGDMAHAKIFYSAAKASDNIMVLRAGT